MPLPKSLPSIVLGIAFVLLATSLATAQTSPRDIRVIAAPTTVWSWSNSTKCGGGNDFSDVPARPFMAGSHVLWFAGNATRYASVGTSGNMATSTDGKDMLATLQRGLAPGPPACVQWIPEAPARQAQPPWYPSSVPATYDTALWMAAPFFDGRTVHALVHNEFHGDWTGSATWCPTQTATIYLPCSYWNVVSATSADRGQSFQLNQARPGVNVPAIALANRYVVPPAKAPPAAGPQGMTAQSNILQSGDYYYALALQLLAPNVPDRVKALNGACIWRAPVAQGPLAWTGWDGSAWSVTAPAAYPAGGQATTSPPLCKPVLKAFFRSSWSFNIYAGGGVLVIGQDSLANLETNNVDTAGCPYAPGASAETADAAFVYVVTAKLPIPPPPPSTLLPPPTPPHALPPRLQQDSETCLLQINSLNNASTNTRQAYPSLLDPISPVLYTGDGNFQYTANRPYLYFTQMNPMGPDNPRGWDRDLVRMAVEVFPGPLPGR
jgi:hypothetical protein